MKCGKGGEFIINMKKVKIALVIVLTLLLTACHDTHIYRGEFPELHIIAIESVIGTIGDEMNRVIFLDEDMYGRKLFAYLGRAYFNRELEEPYSLAIVIAQKTNDQYAFYYDTNNYIVVTVESKYNELYEEKVYSYFTQDEIDALKVANDWDQPINETRLFRADVVRKRNYNKFDIRNLRPFANQFEGEILNSYILCYSTDKNGKTLLAVMTKDQNSKYRTYLVMLDKVGNLVSDKSIIEIIDHLEETSIIRDFKILNGWTFY